MAVGLVILLFEGALIKLLEAEGAHKVLRVELLAHGCDAAAGDGLLAAGAQRATPLVVVGLAVRLAVVVKEAAINKWREAFLEDMADIYVGKNTLQRFFSFKYTAHPPSDSPCRQSIQGARASLEQKCSSRGWHGHNHRI